MSEKHQAENELGEMRPGAPETAEGGIQKGWSTLAVRRPITVAMLLLSVMIFGGIAMSRLPLAFLPTVDVPFIGIEVPYPNSNPMQVEREITKPIEEVLGTLSGVKSMRSTSTPDSANIQMQFDWGHDIDVVRMQVSEKMEQVRPELPANVGEIFIVSFNTADIPVVEGRISSTGLDLSQNYELLESRVMNRIRRIPGVARVTLDGIEPRELFIDLHLDKVKELRVDIGQLTQLLRSSSQNLVLGEVETEGKRFTARAVGNFSSVEALAEMVINERGLRLRDIADVTYEEPPIEFGRHLDHTDAVALTVFKESTANTVDVVRAVLAEIDGEIASDPLLQGINLFMWQNQADQITESLDGLLEAGAIGGLLAILVIYFFLRRWGPTLIVSLSIPFSIVAACGVLFFMGKSLNVLSMMGLMLGVGMLVDNAIVVLESIDRHKRLNKDPKEAAATGTQAVALAVLASTCTSLIVFLPLIVGSKSELTTWLGEVGLTIALAMACSLLSSLSMIPMLTARFLKPQPSVQLSWMAWLENKYADVLGWTLRHRGKTLGLLALGLAIGFAPFFLGMVESNMFGATINERIFLGYEFTDFHYKGDAEAKVTQVEQVIEKHRDEFGIKSIYSFFRANEAGTTLTLNRRDLDDKEIKELRKKIREILPELAGVKLSFEEDNEQSNGTTSFAVNLYGQDSTVLAKLADETVRRLSTVDGVAEIKTSIAQSRQEIEVKVDRDKIARLGLDAQEVSDTMSFVLGSVRLPRFSNGEREVDTWLALRLQDRSRLEDLRTIPFRNINGRPVLLGDIATFQVIDKPMEIDRENRKVRVAVRATYEGESWEKTKEEVAALMDAFELPGGYSWSWNRRILEQDSDGNQMAINMLLALALVYLVIASLFESLAQPFAILFSIPFAIPGAAWLLGLTGTPMNLMSQIGLLILMGVVVNNGIVLLDHMNQLRAEGMERHAAIVQAGRDRLRAILMTAATTIMGMVPMALGSTKAGGLFYFPLALTLIGGLITSTILTLLVLPIINLMIELVVEWWGKVWRGQTKKAKTAERPVDPNVDGVLPEPPPTIAGG